MKRSSPLGEIADSSRCLWWEEPVDIWTVGRRFIGAAIMLQAFTNYGKGEKLLPPAKAEEIKVSCRL